MDSHVYPVPIPSLTLSVHRQLYVIELDTQSFLNACECDDVERIKKRLHYQLFIHNEANTMFDGTLVHTDSHFLIAFPYCGALPVSFLTYEFAINTNADTFQVLCKHHKFIEPSLSTNVSLSIQRMQEFDEISEATESDDIASNEEDEEEEDPNEQDVPDEQEVDPDEEDQHEQEEEEEEEEEQENQDNQDEQEEEQDEEQKKDTTHQSVVNCNDSTYNPEHSSDVDNVHSSYTGRSITKHKAQPNTKCRVTVTAEDVLSSISQNKH